MSEFHESSTRPQKRSFIKAFKAWRGMLRAIRVGDNNKRLQHILELLEHLEGDYYYREWQRLSPQFSDFSLSEKLKEAKHMPKDSLGHSYYLHATDGKEDKFSLLSASSSHSERSDRFSIFRKRTLEIHDLIHVVMGYDKSRMGEACVIRASASAGLPPAWNFFMLLGMVRQTWVRGLWNGIGVWRACMIEPKKRVRNVQNWNDIRWEELLDEPLEDVKRRLGIGPSPVYDRLIGYSNHVDKEWTN